jgi:hypothetical protein
MKKFQSISYRFLTVPKQLHVLMAFLTVFLVFGFLIVTNANSASSENKLLTGRAAQSTVTGVWNAQLNSNTSGIDITLQRQHRMTTWTERLTPSESELKGFPLKGATLVKTDVNFQIVREAGTFECEGYFRDGKGAGFWKFTPSQNFISTMRARGYDYLTEDDLFAAAIANVSVKMIEDLKSFGYDRLSFDQLFRAGAFHVTPEFIRAWHSAGFKNLLFEQLVDLGTFNVTPEYLNEIKASGYKNVTLEELTQARTFGVTTDFIQSWRSAGFKDISLQEITELATFNVTPEYLNEIKASGFPQITPHESVQLRIHGINSDYIKRVRARGFPNVTLDELVNLRLHSIVE